MIGKLFVDATVLKFDKVGTYAIGPNDYGLNKFVKINVDYVNVQSRQILGHLQLQLV